MKTRVTKLCKNFQVFYFLFCFSFIFTNIYGQDDPSPLEWFTFYGAHPTEIYHTDQGKAIFEYEGYLYVGGFVSGPGNFDGAIIKRPYQGGGDAFIAKMSLDGITVEWVTFFGAFHGNERDECLDIVVADGSIYACGYSGNWADEASYTVKHPHFCCGGHDAFVARLNLAGDIEWVSFLGGDQQDYATALSVDISGGFIYAAGHSIRSWAVDSYQLAPLNGISNDWQYDAFVVKLNLNGDYIWHTFMGDDEGNGMWDYSSGIGHDALGNIYVGGSSTGTWGSPLAGFEHHGLPGDINPADGFVAKLAPDGTPLWNMFIGNEDGVLTDDRCLGIEVDLDGNIYATGSSPGSWGPQWGTPVSEYGWNEDNDIFVTKIDNSGTPLWHTFLGAGGGNIGEDLVLMSDGSIGVCGRDADSNWGNFAFPKYVDGGLDAFTAKLDGQGNLLWNARVGGFYADWGYSLTADDNGNLYTTGFSQCPWVCMGAPLHPHVGWSANGYHNEIFITKLNTNLNSIIPENNELSVIEGDMASVLVHVFDPCNSLAGLTTNIGELTNNLDGTWTWSLNAEAIPPDLYHIEISANDGNGCSTGSALELEVQPSNQDPVFEVDTDPVTVFLGDPAINTGIVSDPDGDELWMNSDPGGPGAIVNHGDGTWTWSYPSLDLGLGSHQVTLWVDDGNGGVVYRFFDVNVIPDLNNPPEITSVSGPAGPIALGEPANFLITFIDENPDYFSIDWGDGMSEPLNEISSPQSASHTYDQPGVYEVGITLFDELGESDYELYQYVVVYDPSAGFVTGGGWIISPPGAYPENPDIEGRANFGFVSKYKKGSDLPEGNTEFQFKTADMNFKSFSYDWLVIAGHKAMFKGEGTINQEGWYGFILTAVDAQLTPSTDTDLFRIKIWDKNNSDVIVYDNNIDLPDVDEPQTQISGGSIKIHKGGKSSELGLAKTDVSTVFSVYPNPFSDNVWFEFKLDEDSRIVLDIFDLTGRKLESIINQEVKSGEYCRLNYQPGKNVANGIFFYQLKINDQVKTGKLIRRK